MQGKALSFKILLITFSLIVTGSLNLNAENLIESKIKRDNHDSSEAMATDEFKCSKCKQRKCMESA